MESAISNISSIRENVADLVKLIIKYEAVKNQNIRR